MPISNISTNNDQQPVQAQPAPVKPLAGPDNGVVYATDSRGRRLGCKKLTAIDLFDLTAALGENSGNKAMLNQAMIAASVVEIDGIPSPRPTNSIQLRARITILDFDGYLAVSEALTSASTVASVNLDAVKN